MKEPPQKVDALLLDFDGTLAGSLQPMWDAYCRFATACRFAPTTAEFEELNGPPLDQIVQHLRTKHNLELDQKTALSRYREEVAWAQERVHPTPGALSLLEAARSRGWRTGIVTSNSRETVVAFLSRHGVSDRIDCIVDCALSPGKPDPAPYRSALATLGVAASAALAVEDSRQGVAAASAAGLYTFAYAPFDRTPPSGAADRVESLPRTLDRLDPSAPRLRLAKEADRPFLFALRNREEDVAYFTTPRRLEPSELEQRFTLDPTLTRRLTFILESASRSTAMLRLDQRGEASYEIGVAVAPAARGEGLGRRGVEQAMDAVAAMHGPVRFTASVAIENAASLRLFDSCGFTRVGTSDRFQLFAKLGASR
ncbi:MAG: HAD-IA family hydrolase [Marivibrio sp.]|uniref:HAD-IA family hydrolase n=1 Tax=Marivibrio sp. TaxID=2039719 RepID=UPI0032EB9F3F